MKKSYRVLLIGLVWVGVVLIFLLMDMWYTNFVTDAEPTPTPVWASFPSAAPAGTEAIYQTFEHGFMVWRADVNCVYALVRQQGLDNTGDAIIPRSIPGDNAYGYCLAIAPLTDLPATETPLTGLSVPTGVLGVAWNYYAELQQGLGFATAPEVQYQTRVTESDSASAAEGTPDTLAQMTLPDGQTLVCGSCGATAGTCSW